MSTVTLTDRQQEMLNFIRKFSVDKGYAPSFREIGSAMKIASPNGVKCHLESLKKKGFITAHQGRARTIKIVNGDPEFLEKFWDELSLWSQATFGPDNVRGPNGPLKHLAKEVDECLQNPSDIVEYADLVFLAFDAARRAGFTFEQLKEAIFKKLEVNKSRTWNVPSSDEPVEHVR